MARSNAPVVVSVGDVPAATAPADVPDVPKDGRRPRRLFVVREVRAEWVENIHLVEIDPHDPTIEQGLDDDGLRELAKEYLWDGSAEWIGERCIESDETLDPRSLVVERDDEVTATGSDADERIAAAVSALHDQNRREGRVVPEAGSDAGT